MTQQKRSMSPLALILTLSAIFFALFLVVSGAMMLYKSPKGGGGRSGSGFFDSGSVGVIELKGVIMDSKKTLKKLERFEDDDQIKAVVLRLNSPGGSVAPSQEIYEAVRAYKKPLVVSMGSVAASGAFYIACGAKKVFANPGTITGSIGVIMEFANLQKLYDWAKVQRYSLTTGKFKDSGASYREMTKEERALLQGMIDDVLGQFKKAVATGRHLSMDQVSAIADGRIMSGSQAKNAKLVDELGTIQDAIQEAGKLGHIKGKPHVVYSDKQKLGLLDLFLDDSPLEESSQSSLLRGKSGTLLIPILEKFILNRSAGEENHSSGVYWLWGGAGLGE